MKYYKESDKLIRTYNNTPIAIVRSQFPRVDTINESTLLEIITKFKGTPIWVPNGPHMEVLDLAEPEVRTSTNGVWISLSDSIAEQVQQAADDNEETFTEYAQRVFLAGLEFLNLARKL